MTELESLDVYAEQYRRDGYTVAVRPNNDLARYLDLPDVDMLATKNDEIIAIKIRQHGDRKDKPVVVASGTISNDYSLSLLQEAERLQMPETRRSALLMAWTAFEAASREVLFGSKPNPQARTPRALIQDLLNAGHIDQTRAEQLQQSLYLRNVIVHGVQPDDVPLESVTFLLETVRALKHHQITQQFSLHDKIAVTIIRDSLFRQSGLRKQVETATQLLDDVLGPSSQVVTVEWDLGQDGFGNDVLILKLSDFTGTVSGSFTPDELSKPAHMKNRFYGLWSALLRIRISEQLETILGHQETVSHA